MHANASEHPVLVTEPAWNTTANRERIAEMMFEEFQVPAFYIANTGVLNAYGTTFSSSRIPSIPFLGLPQEKVPPWSLMWGTLWRASPQLSTVSY